MNRIITLYHGSGSLGFQVDGPALGEKEWQEIRRTAIDLLTKRGKKRAANLLETEGFRVERGVNDWGDDFSVLYREVNLDDYVRYDELAKSPEARTAFEDIAKVITEIGPFVRFVGVELVRDSSPQPVPTPRPKITSAVVEAALIDAERLITERSPVSAVDRAHTALHGYLKRVCVDAKLAMESDDLSLTDLIKRIRDQHPKFRGKAGHEEQTGKVLKAMGVICDALNPMRNRGSLAHPNQELLDEPSAMLAINASRTILHYVHHRLQS